MERPSWCECERIEDQAERLAPYVAHSAAQGAILGERLRLARRYGHGPTWTSVAQKGKVLR